MAKPLAQLGAGCHLLEPLLRRQSRRESRATKEGTATQGWAADRGCQSEAAWYHGSGGVTACLLHCRALGPLSISEGGLGARQQPT